MFTHTHSPATRGAHLNVDGVSKSFPDRRVLTNVSFTVAAGERAALIGENGTGKSTLLRILAGLDEADAGSVSFPGEVGLFHQQPPFSLDLTVAQALEQAVTPIRALTDAVTLASEAISERPDDVGAQQQLEQALDAADLANAWEIEHTLELVLDGLGIARIPPGRYMHELSGGQQSRFSLAWTLIRRPMTLLLDEPTNHLDDRGAATLAQLIREWPGPVLIASHDRAFLDDVVTDLIDLDPQPVAHTAVRSALGAADAGAGFGVARFTGSYSDYVRERFDARERWEKQYVREQEELKQLRQAVHDNHRVGRPERGPRTEARGAKKFYSDKNAKVVSRRVNDVRTTLERLEAEQVRRPPAQLRFRGLSRASASSSQPSPQSSSQSSGSVLTAANVQVAGRLAPTSLSVEGNGRLLIEGPNGCGKSTLLKVLAGQLKPSGGSVTASGRLRVAMLSQDAQIHGDGTVLEEYVRALGQELAEKVPLATFGLIAGRDENRPLASLSVGQRRRVDLAVLLASPPDVLLLDEPTNHFSLTLADDIERSIDEYPGAVIIASHDRMLRQRWAHPRLTMAPPMWEESLLDTPK